MLAAAIVVLVIAQDIEDPVSVAFARAARGVLGESASVRLIAVEADPPDEESAARAEGATGVVELSWSNDGTRATIHSYVSSERRWIDREITFSSGGGAREASEKGRLLGFAAASMFATYAPAPAEPEAPVSKPPPPPRPTAKPTLGDEDAPRAEPEAAPGAASSLLASSARA